MLFHKRCGTAIASGKCERSLRALFKLCSNVRTAAAHDTLTEPLARVARGGQSACRLGADGDEPVPCAKLFYRLLRQGVAAAGVFAFDAQQTGADKQVFHRLIPRKAPQMPPTM